MYQLARVETEDRNKFQLLVKVQFFSSPGSDVVVSNPFLIRTHKKEAEPEPGRLKRPFHTWSQPGPSKRPAVETPVSTSPASDPDSTTRESIHKANQYCRMLEGILCLLNTFALALYVK